MEKTSIVPLPCLALAPEGGSPSRYCGRGTTRTAAA
jgi:hypothetical protein